MKLFTPYYHLHLCMLITYGSKQTLKIHICPKRHMVDRMDIRSKVKLRSGGLIYNQTCVVGDENSNWQLATLQGSLSDGSAAPALFNPRKSSTASQAFLLASCTFGKTMVARSLGHDLFGLPDPVSMRFQAWEIARRLFHQGHRFARRT